VKNDIINIEMI